MHINELLPPHETKSLKTKSLNHAALECEEICCDYKPNQHVH